MVGILSSSLSFSSFPFSFFVLFALVGRYVGKYDKYGSTNFPRRRRRRHN